MNQQTGRTPSIPILHRKCRAHFASKGLPEPIFAGSRPVVFSKRKHEFDIVLLADPIGALLASHAWPKDARFRLWTLSERVAQSLKTVFGIPRNRLSYVPRHSLFELKAPERAFPDFNQAARFVFSGRPYILKNYGLTMEVVRRIQTLRPQAQISFFTAHPASVPVGQKAVGASALWTAEPESQIFSSGDWAQRLNRDDSVLINLSIQSKEDFGVSLAQAQQRGWPMIVSAWGAHSDLVGRNILRIDAADIARRDVDKIARDILKWTPATSAVTHPTIRNEKAPPVAAWTSYHDLTEWVAGFRERSADSIEMKSLWFSLMAGSQPKSH